MAPKKISAVAGLMLFGALSVMLPFSAQAGVQKSPFDSMDSLIAQADLIIRGHVQRIKKDLRHTTILIGVDQVLKGEGVGESVLLRHRGGKFLYDPEEPDFQTYDQAILYLVREGDFYRCLSGAEGKKTILNENVYLHPENKFVNMKLEKYVEELSKRLVSSSSANTESDPAN